MTLVETGTRALIGAVFGPATSETGYASQLLRLLSRDMLVRADRGFDAVGFLEQLAAASAQFPDPDDCHPPPAGAGPAGRPLLPARIGNLTLRIITA